MHDIHTQLAVIGAGPAGVCAALSAARLGVETVLVGNRPVLGGNSSSEIRVWTRGATGAGNMFAEEMGVWGGLKLENLYKNPDANPIFWDEILLDAVLREENLRLYLNTEIAELEMCEGNILAISGVQQGSGNHIRITAEMFLDATGDGVLGNLAGVPWVMGSEPGGETLGNSILYYTKREDHPVPFIPPDYAYSMEQIDNILGRGGRMINERMGGSDCWWFEYGGLLDTIKDSQEIAIELKRLVMGVWNYIKNSGKFESEFYTLEWMGSVPGKRESRRMVTEYVLTSEDILSGRTFYDGGFYGGWYIDSHPAGGVHASGEENCVQVPINVYQIPLRCLYHREVSNLLFAGRIIGVDQNVFFSSRIMNTCALSGQAAATLAATCIRTKLSPAELPEAALREIQQTLLRDDMLIPGVQSADCDDHARNAKVCVSSTHSGRSGEQSGSFSLEHGGFVVFPACGGGRIKLRVQCDQPIELKASLYLDKLPSRLCPGTFAGERSWQLNVGSNEIGEMIPQSFDGQFCAWKFPPTPGVSLELCPRERAGFLCGRSGSPDYFEPMMEYEQTKDIHLYEPEQVQNGWGRPWGGPNQWCASPLDRTPWLELQWEQEVQVNEIRLYLDPDLTMELPSSRAKNWEASHLFAPRFGMPAQLVRDFSISAQGRDGQWTELCRVENNCQRMVKLKTETRRISRLRMDIRKTWGDKPPAVYEIRVYDRQDIL